MFRLGLMERPSKYSVERFFENRQGEKMLKKIIIKTAIIFSSVISFVLASDFSNQDDNSNSGIRNQVRFMASLGYEPGFLTKGQDYWHFSSVDALSNPYGAYYLSHGLSAKAGIEAFGGWELRAIGSYGQDFIRNGEPNIRFTDTSWFSVSSGHTKWIGEEASVGGEFGHAFRLKGGKADIYLGVEEVWNRLHGEAILTNDSLDIDTFSIFTHGSGIQGHIGMDLPLATFGNFVLSTNLKLRAGIVPQTPDSIPQGSSWTGTNGLPRWGFSLGLNLGYDSRKQGDLENLPDLRLKPIRKDSLAQVLKRPKGCCLTGIGIPAWLIEGAGAWGLGFVVGPLASLASLAWGGNGKGPVLNVLEYGITGNYSSSRSISISAWSYLGVPLGSAAGGIILCNRLQPGGDWRYAALGAIAGDILSFAITQTTLILGGIPWLYGPDGNPYGGDDNPWLAVSILAGSTLPAIGAVLGYNLSIPRIEQIDEGLEYRPSWTEYAMQNSLNEIETSRSNRTGTRMEVTLLRANF